MGYPAAHFLLTCPGRSGSRAALLQVAINDCPPSSPKVGFLFKEHYERVLNFVLVELFAIPLSRALSRIAAAHPPGQAPLPVTAEDRMLCDLGSVGHDSPDEEALGDDE